MAEGSVALSARRLDRRQLGGKCPRKTASEPLAVQPSSRQRYAGYADTLSAGSSPAIATWFLPFFLA